MGAAQHNADIQYKESFITECSITNNVIDTGKNAVLNHEVEVLVSDQVPSDSPDEKAAYVRLILDGDYSTKGEPKASCKYHMVIQGLFSVEKDMPDVELNRKLWFNGSTILYGIARAKMEVISTMVLNNGKISLPLLNMYELLKERFEGNEKKDK